MPQRSAYMKLRWGYAVGGFIFFGYAGMRRLSHGKYAVGVVDLIICALFLLYLFHLNRKQLKALGEIAEIHREKGLCGDGLRISVCGHCGLNVTRDCATCFKCGAPIDNIGGLGLQYSKRVVQRFQHSISTYDEALSRIESAFEYTGYQPYTNYYDEHVWRNAKSRLKTRFVKIEFSCDEIVLLGWLTEGKDEFAEEGVRDNGSCDTDLKLMMDKLQRCLCDEPTS